MKKIVIALLMLVTYAAQATGVPTPVGGTYVNGVLCNVLDLKSSSNGNGSSLTLGKQVSSFNVSASNINGVAGQASTFSAGALENVSTGSGVGSGTAQGAVKTTVAAQDGTFKAVATANSSNMSTIQTNGSADSLNQSDIKFTGTKAPDGTISDIKEGFSNTVTHISPANATSTANGSIKATVSAVAVKLVGSVTPCLTCK
jgi:hypothetical protein